MFQKSSSGNNIPSLCRVYGNVSIDCYPQTDTDPNQNITKATVDLFNPQGIQTSLT
jgi:hypothetical protein